MNGSIINLALITVGRYLRVVHAVWSKKKERKWMRHAAVAFSWIASIGYTLPVVFASTAVVDGACYAYAFWKDKMTSVIYTVCNVMISYVIVLLIFIFCYWRRAHSGCHPSSGKSDGIAQCRWTKHSHRSVRVR